MATLRYAPYLAGLDLRGRRVLVVGAGAVAAHRIVRLVAAGADVLVVAPDAPGLDPDARDPAPITLRRRRFEPADVDGAWYVLACTDDPQVNAAVVHAATAARVFCVRADAAEHGTAVTPAVGGHDGVTVGVLARGDHSRSARVRGAVLDALRGGLIGTGS